MRWLDGITDSMAMSLSKLWEWWWTGKPGMLQSTGSKRVEHDLVTEQQQQRNKLVIQSRKQTWKSWGPVLLIYISEINVKAQNLQVQREQSGSPPNLPARATISPWLLGYLFLEHPSWGVLFLSKQTWIHILPCPFYQHTWQHILHLGFSIKTHPADLSITA